MEGQPPALVAPSEATEREARKRKDHQQAVSSTGTATNARTTASGAVKVAGTPSKSTSAPLPGASKAVNGDSPQPGVPASESTSKSPASPSTGSSTTTNDADPSTSSYTSPDTTTDSAHHHGGGHGHHHHHSTVVPAYPYNVSMSPFIPGVTSSRQDSYFEQHVPDDSNVQTRLPSICVDYLSHDWEEDDVWTSWKAMTKHKSEIANGVRLENASWRTWAKQRGRLKTISPETLNWLKDSDVTWLYGPLHTAVEPVPAPRAATAEDYLGLDKTTSRPSVAGTKDAASKNKGGRPAITVKPILKHRSLSDILSVPQSGSSSPVLEAINSYENSEDEEYNSGGDAETSSEDEHFRQTQQHTQHNKHQPHGPSHLNINVNSSDSAFSSSSSLSSSSATSSNSHSPQSSHDNTPRGDGAQSPDQTRRRPKIPKTKSESSVNEDDGKPHRRRKTRTGSGSSPPRIATSTNSRASQQPSETDSGSAHVSNRHRRASHDHLHHYGRSTSHSSMHNPHHDAAHEGHHRPTSRRTLSHDAHGGHGSDPGVGRSSGSFHSQAPPKKKHITFNHRVEQCISIDIDEDAIQRSQQGKYGKNDLQSNQNNSSQPPYSNSLQRYGGSSRQQQHSSSSSSSSDDDDEEVLTFRSSSPKSSTFMKPFLASPTDPNGPASKGFPPPNSTGGGFGVSGTSHGPHSAQYHYLNDMHTIVKLEPTTLKESELLPGPTPIVVYEDGKITALYGTEDDYVFDQDDARLGEFDLDELKRTTSRNTAVIDDDYDDDEVEEEFEEDVEVTEEEEEEEEEEETTAATYGVGEIDGDSDEHYNATPTRAIAIPISGAKAYNQADPASTSDRFEDPNASLVNASGATNAKTDYFGGPDPSLADDQYKNSSTSSQSKYGATASSTATDYSRGASAGSLQNSNHLVSASATSADNSGLLSSSPSSRGGPTKSILKKQREISSEYYPPIAPASTRASRAHAAMFTEDGEEIVSVTRGRSAAAPDSQTGQIVNASSDNSSSAGAAASSISSNNNATTAEPEPTRGRSTSRGSSSSSLLDRANSGTSGSGVGDPYSTSRTRSVSSGGGSN